MENRISLKVDVDTYRGTREGIPELLRLFDEYRVRATFLFSLGPDHTGRALRRVFRPGFLRKVSRTSVIDHYGWKTLLYGTLLPGPHIGRRAGATMRAVANAGHEVGIHCYDHVRWQDFVTQRDPAWTKREFERASNAFFEVFGRPAQVHGAAGWQINPHVLALEEKGGFRYASDVRGNSPFYPVMQGVESRCLQLPTTLPTLDELIGVDGVDAENVHDRVIRESAQAVGFGHVYTLHAELEGMQLLPVMRRLLSGWTERDFVIGALDDAVQTLALERVAKHEIEMAAVDGRSGLVASQGRVVDGTVDAVRY